MTVPSIFRSWKSKIFDEEICHAPEVYTDAELQRLKNAGHTGIWVAGILRELSCSMIFPEFNRKKNTFRQKALNHLVQRARKHGLDVFVYLVEPRNLNITDSFWKKYPELRGTRGTAAVVEYEYGYAMCTSDKRVLDFLEDATANLFRMVPGLKGLILVTASEHLHHCLSFATPVWPHLYQKQYPDLCPRCRDRKAVEIVSEIINAIVRGAFSVNKEAQLIASAWGWTWYEEVPHAELIDALDPRVAIETFLEKGGVKRYPDQGKITINEYALSYSGPSPYVRKLAAYLARKRRKLYLKLVLGTTHELITIPCLPVPTRVYEKVSRAARLKPYGYLSFTFGTMPCINLRVFEKFIALKRQPQNKKEFLRMVAEEYFPGGQFEKLYQAWRYFLSALDLYPFSNKLMYYGPVSFALAYCQYPGPVKGSPMRPTWLPFFRHGDDLSSVCTDFPEKTIIKRFEEMARRWNRGLVYYRQALATVCPQRKNRELAIAEIIPLIFLSVANIFRIHLLKKNWNRRCLDTFFQILREEWKVCQQALPLLKMNPLLGYHIEAGQHLFSEKLVRQKMRHIENLLPDKRQVQPPFPAGGKTHR
ncbi:MAG TPA: hypothetical protein PKX93_03430 [bacterium]|nr:hypothetical protein [bacterium]HPP12285.1 hypothetical protein [bacterium]